VKDVFDGFVALPNGDLVPDFPRGLSWTEQQIGVGVLRCPEPVAEDEQPAAGPTRDLIIAWLRKQGRPVRLIAARFGISESRVYKITARSGGCAPRCPQ
jgi:hypothetical protein